MEQRWRDFIHDMRGEFFGVDFIKRTTSELRRMNCRCGVKIGVQNSGRFIKQDKRNKLMRVWDVQKRAFRSIPLDAIQCIRWRGRVW